MNCPSFTYWTYRRSQSRVSRSAAIWSSWRDWSTATEKSSSPKWKASGTLLSKNTWEPASVMAEGIFRCRASFFTIPPNKHSTAELWLTGHHVITMFPCWSNHIASSSDWPVVGLGWVGWGVGIRVILEEWRWENRIQDTEQCYLRSTP